MKNLVKYLKNYKKQLIIGPIFKLTEAIFELIVPVVTALIIDNGVEAGDTAYVWKMGSVLLLLGVVGLCCALVCQYNASIASQGFGTVLRRDLYRHMNTLSHKELDKLGTASLITRITSDVNQLQFAVAMLIRLVIRAPFLAVGAVVCAMMIDLKLSIIFLVITPIIALVLYLIMKKSVPFFKVAQQKLDVISGISREGLSGARVIRAFSKQETEQKRFDDASKEQADISIGVGKLSALLNPLTYAIMNFGIIAIVWFGGYRVEAGGMTKGEVVAFVNYMTQTYLALVVVANLVVTFTKAAASAARVSEVLQTESTVTELREGVVTDEGPVAEGTPKVAFEDVSFSYIGSQVASTDTPHEAHGEKYALKHINITVNAGETVGIIGGTGSGKSTFANLISRFYDPDHGVVKVDGVDVKQYAFARLRHKIGMVPQKAVLFSGTIESNLKWGNPDATEEELWQALEIAQAKDFVEQLPQGLQSPVEQGGRNFSGGQRQRLTIARAIAQHPEILILDDSASALDFATDAHLRKAIRENSRGTTVFLISQRASTIRHADKILVFDNGEIVGVGTHDALYAQCSVYREICLSQLSEKEAKGV